MKFIFLKTNLQFICSHTISVLSHAWLFCYSLPSKESFDSTPDVLTYKAGEDLLDLDAQIRSMFTRSDISAGNGQGKMALCNVCGKEKYYKHMLQHIEANHITGVSHAWKGVQVKKCFE